MYSSNNHGNVHYLISHVYVLSTKIPVGLFLHVQKSIYIVNVFEIKYYQMTIERVSEGPSSFSFLVLFTVFIIIVFASNNHK
jgi:hypothetical protein